MKSDGILVERRGEACIVTLDRGRQANALDGATVESLHAALEQAEADGARVLALQGDGRNFSAGFDLSGIEEATEGELLWRFARIQLLLERLESTPLLTVALAHGANFGAGVDLFAACRWRFATECASFRMPGLAFGLVLGTRRFAAIVGHEPARDILEQTRTLDAREAERLGLVRRIVARQELDAILAVAREQTAVLPAPSRALLARTLDTASSDAALSALVRCVASPGFRENIQQYARSRRKSTA